jgi:hypothetical protein
MPKVTVPFDTFFGCAAGSMIALIARRPLVRTHDPMHSRYFGVTVMFGVGAMVPSGVTFYALFPDWSLMYLANPEHLSKWIMFPLLTVIYACAPIAGFLLTHRFLLEQRPRAPAVLLSSLSTLIVATLIFGRDRLLTVAYYDAFYAGGATLPLFRSRLAIMLPLACVAIGALFLAVLIAVRRHVQLTESLPEAQPSQKRALADQLSSEAG